MRCDMSDTERIIENVNATMGMEGMPLSDEDRERVKECIEGKVSFQSAVEQLIGKYTRKVV